MFEAAWLVPHCPVLTASLPALRQTRAFPETIQSAKPDTADCDQTEIDGMSKIALQFGHLNPQAAARNHCRRTGNRQNLRCTGPRSLCFLTAQQKFFKLTPPPRPRMILKVRAGGRAMTLLLTNDDVQSLLDMPMVIGALEKSYLELAEGNAVCRTASNLQLPTDKQNETYQWGTTDGGSSASYLAIRMTSDVRYETEVGGKKQQDKYCVAKGTYCGLVFL